MRETNIRHLANRTIQAGWGLSAERWALSSLIVSEISGRAKELYQTTANHGGDLTASSCIAIFIILFLVGPTTYGQVAKHSLSFHSLVHVACQSLSCLLSPTMATFGTMR
jgi:hypothetical protein